MRKFIIKVFILGISILVLAVIATVIIDPYNVFHVFSVRENGVEPNKNYIKMNYILEYPNKFNSFMFGSSRVGYINTEDIDDVSCYNMTYSMGLPSEHLNNIITLIENGIVPKRIYMGVDSYSYTVLPESHYTDRLRAPYEYLVTNPKEFIKLYCEPAIVGNSIIQGIISRIGNEKNLSYTERFYNSGSGARQDGDIKLNPAMAKPVFGSGLFIDETINEIEQIKELCDENDIELIVFTNPMYKVTYIASVEGKAYFDFLSKLAEITPFYNFSSLNNITMNAGNYCDDSHFNSIVGDIILDNICNGKTDNELLQQGFGVLVDKENIAELLQLLSSQLEFESENSAVYF